MKTDLDTNPLDKLPPILKKNLDKNLCVCNEVPRMDIINAIVNGAVTVEAVKKQTYATMGSGCCIQQASFSALAPASLYILHLSRRRPLVSPSP